MSDSKRTDKYRKNQESEDLLGKINRIMEPLELEEIKGFTTPRFATVFVIGAPRSATTLIHQLVADTGLFGYISNYLARFWAAPYIGALQEKALGLRVNQDMTHDSDYGRTEGLNEPHQFNYFWQKWYQYDKNHQMSQEVIDRIDINLFRKEMAALESVLGLPLVFKSLYCSLQIPFLKKALPKSKFVICTRSPLYQAQSILGGRKAFFGTYNGWFSLKPPEYYKLIKLPPFEQVAGQILHILKGIGRGLSHIDQTDFIMVDQRDLAKNPLAAIEAITALAGIEASDNALSRIPESFKDRNEQTLNDEEWTALKRAIDDYFGGQSSKEVIFEAHGANS
jgi:hypothetical protein